MFSKYDAHALMDRCFDLTGLGCDTFIHYAPHTDRVYISYFQGKWEDKDGHADKLLEVVPANEEPDPEYLQMSVGEAIVFLDEKIKEARHGIGDEE